MLSKIDEDPLKVWEKSLENITPHVEVRAEGLEEHTFQIPQPVREDRKVSLGMKWLITVLEVEMKTMSIIDASEIMAGYKEEGAPIKRKWILIEWLKAVETFSHFRF